MMMQFITGIISICIFASTAIAEDHSITYSPVPTGSERELDPLYERFSGWHSIYIVKEGEVEPPANMLGTSSWSPKISLEELQDLRVQDLDFIVSEITVNANSAVIPFAVGLRFLEKGFTGNLTFFQGTIESEGKIILSLVNGVVSEIQIVRFYDSQRAERFGRKVGFIDEYDGEFAFSVITPILTNYFSQEEKLSGLIQMVQSSDASKNLP